MAPTDVGGYEGAEQDAVQELLGAAQDFGRGNGGVFAAEAGESMALAEDASRRSKAASQWAVANVNRSRFVFSGRALSLDLNGARGEEPAI
jgi:hypothetical protein